MGKILYLANLDSFMKLIRQIKSKGGVTKKAVTDPALYLDVMSLARS